MRSCRMTKLLNYTGMPHVLPIISRKNLNLVAEKNTVSYKKSNRILGWERLLLCMTFIRGKLYLQLYTNEYSHSANPF